MVQTGAFRELRQARGYKAEPISCAILASRGACFWELQIHVGAQYLAIWRIPYYDVPSFVFRCFCNFFSLFHFVNLLGFRPLSCPSYGVALVFSKEKDDIDRFNNISLNLLWSISPYTFYIFGTFYLLSEELLLILFSEKWM